MLPLAYTQSRGAEIYNYFHTDCAFFYIPSKSRHGRHLSLAYRRKANSQVLASLENATLALKSTPADTVTLNITKSIFLYCPSTIYLFIIFLHAFSLIFNHMLSISFMTTPPSHINLSRSGICVVDLICSCAFY